MTVSSKGVMPVFMQGLNKLPEEGHLSPQPLQQRVTVTK
jgi:hypothetical protein